MGPYPLPPGLPERAAVECIDAGGMNVRVRDAAGAEWDLYHWQLDCGREYPGPDGRWCHESNLGVLAAIQESLLTVFAKPYEHSLQNDIREAAREAEWVLQRNGWKGTK